MESLFFFPLLSSSVESTLWPGMKTTSHEWEESERADESSSTNEIFTTEEVHSRTEKLPCLLSVLFLTWHRGTCFPLRCPIYAISEREVITQRCGGMLFILSALPASLLEIRLLSGQLKDACLLRLTCLAEMEKRNATERTERLWSLPFHHLCN